MKQNNKQVIDNIVSTIKQTLCRQLLEGVLTGIEGNTLYYVYHLLNTGFPGNVKLTSGVCQNYSARLDAILGVLPSCLSVSKLCLSLSCYLSCWTLSIADAEKCGVFQQAEETWNKYLSQYADIRNAKHST